MKVSVDGISTIGRLSILSKVKAEKSLAMREINWSWSECAERRDKPDWFIQSWDLIQRRMHRISKVQCKSFPHKVSGASSGGFVARR